MPRNTIPAFEDHRVMLVCHSPRRASYRDVARKQDEPIEAYAERVKREVIDHLTKINS